MSKEAAGMTPARFNMLRCSPTRKEASIRGGPEERKGRERAVLYIASPSVPGMQVPLLSRQLDEMVVTDHSSPNLGAVELGGDI